MKKTFLYLTFPFLLMIAGCAELQQVATVALQNGIGGVSGNSDALGLKEALRVGIDKSVSSLGSNGFMTDAALKILLPPEAQPIVDNLKLIPGGDKLVNDVVQRLNGAASDAVVEAKPIFVNAITGMSISDATGILFGADNAATSYLQRSTSSQLTAAFAPKVNASLDKKLIGNISTTDSWNVLTSAYNKVANTAIGRVAKMNPVESDLGAYVTQRALDGLFTKVAAEEKQIRTNPAARVNDLLKNVFGQLDKK
jgi:hypothetical protein